MKNQIVTDCYNPCFERTCANLRSGNDRVCPLFCQTDVCECAENFYRNDCDKCVRKEECDAPCTRDDATTCGGQNQVLFSCWDPTMAAVCPNVRVSYPRDNYLKFVNGTNPNGLCIPNMCDCRDGYLRDDCGTCVLPEQCNLGCGGLPNQCQGANEQMRMVELPPICQPIPPPHSRPCRRGKCKKRSCKKHSCKKSKSKSKSKSKCKHSKCRRSEFAQPFQPMEAAQSQCQPQSQMQCDCIDGYARNNCDKCVPVAEAGDVVPCACTNPCSAIPNQEYVCSNPCNARTCENFYTLPFKLCTAECSYGCYCSAGKDLWFNGTACVPSSMCPPPAQTTPGDSGGGVVAL